MSWTHALFTLWLVHLGAATSPGLNFALIGRIATQHTRREAMLVVAGIVTAAALWTSLAIFGLSVMVERAGGFFGLVRTAAGAYLIFLGLQKLRSRPRQPVEPETPADPSRPSWHYLTGLLTNLGNPKTILFFTSLFAAVFPPYAPPAVRGAGAAIVLVNSITVHTGLAYVFSTPRLKHHYLRHGNTLDRLFGVTFIGFGLKVAIDH